MDYFLALFSIAIVPLIIYYFYQYCQFVIAKKMRHSRPWLAFVPFVNNYQFVELAKKPLWWAHIIISPIIAFLLSLIPYLEIVGTILFMISLVVSMVFFFITLFSLTKLRGKSSLFAWGNVCAYYVFFPILAFSDIVHEQKIETHLKKSLTNYLQIAQNISLPYKNFFHWSGAKIILSLYSAITAIVLCVPFYIFTIYTKTKLNDFQNINITEFDRMLSFFVGNIFWVSLYLISLSILIGIYVFFMSYFLLFLQKLYHSYIDKKSFSIFKNGYWNFTMMKKFIGVLSWQSVYILASLTLCLLISFILSPIISSIAQGYMENLDSIIFRGIIAVMFIIIILPLIYISLRTNFAYNLLLDSEDLGQKTENYINQSFDLTKGNIWNMVLLSLPFLIVIGIINEFFSYLQIFIINDGFIFLFWIITMLIIGGISLMVNVSVYRILRNTR